MKYLEINNKIFLVIDSVRFLTPTSAAINISIFKDKDYRIIITHGIMGELLNMVEKNYYGLDKNKLIFLTNNIEIQNIINREGCRSFNISEYIFLNDDFYSITECDKEYDSIYTGRIAKLNLLFNKNYTYVSSIKKCLINEDSEIPSNKIKIEYNKAKSGIMTSESEGSCRSVAEMLMCGLPIVNVKIHQNKKETYYPTNKVTMYDAYKIILPNTLGGRELWLDDCNSINCQRNDNDIDNSIQEIIEKKLSSLKIRENFLSRLFTERLKFLFLLKTALEELDINFFKTDINQIINLPYSNCSVQTTEWNKTINYFKTIFYLNE